MENTAMMGLLIGGLLGLAVVALWIWAVVDIIKSDFKDTIMKVVWLLLVVFIPLLGFILYVVVGRATKLSKEAAAATVSSAKYDDLARVKGLYDSGAISEEEFEAEKRKIMGN